MLGLILAHSMHAVPFVFVTVFSALQSFDLNQPRVAQSLGATPLYAFVSVTLPQIKLSVIAGASERTRSADGIHKSGAAPGLKPSARFNSTVSRGTPIRFFGSPCGVKLIRRRVRVPKSAIVK